MYAAGNESIAVVTDAPLGSAARGFTELMAALFAFVDSLNDCAPDLFLS